MLKIRYGEFLNAKDIAEADYLHNRKNIVLGTLCFMFFALGGFIVSGAMYWYSVFNEPKPQYNVSSYEKAQVLSQQIMTDTGMLRGCRIDSNDAVSIISKVSSACDDSISIQNIRVTEKTTEVKCKADSIDAANRYVKKLSFVDRKVSLIDIKKKPVSNSKGLNAIAPMPGDLEFTVIIAEDVESKKIAEEKAKAAEAARKIEEAKNKKGGKR